MKKEGGERGIADEFTVPIFRSDKRSTFEYGRLSRSLFRIAHTGGRTEKENSVGSAVCVSQQSVPARLPYDSNEETAEVNSQMQNS